MIRTWVFCTAGGLFSVCWANLLARRPVLWSKILVKIKGGVLEMTLCLELHRIVAGGAIGAVAGYYMHRYEEQAEERYKHMIERGQKLPKWMLQGYQPNEGELHSFRYGR